MLQRILALLLSLFTHPSFGALRAGRAGWAAIYLAISVALVAAARFEAGKALGLSHEDFVSLSALVLAVAGATHVFWMSGPGGRLGNPWYAKWTAVLIAIALYVSALAVIAVYPFRPFYIRSASMLPTAAQDQLIWTRTFLPADWRPKRGDAIVYVSAERSETIHWVKRIVGLPGDRVQMIEGALHINGVAVSKRRVADYIDDRNGGERMPQYEVTPPGGAPFRILDTVLSSLDDTEEVLVPEGHYFAMGDNWDNSIDSRSAEIGFVPHDSIVATYLFTL